MQRKRNGRPWGGKFPEIPTTLHERIKYEREVMGWTQDQLGAALGRTNISDIERGVTMVSVALAEEIAEALGISPVRLLGHLRPPDVKRKSIGDGSPAAA